MTPAEIDPPGLPPVPPAALPPALRRRFPTPVQAVVITISGFLLALFGCLGALTDINGNGPAFAIGGIAFAIGLLAFLFGVGVIGFMFVRAVVQTVRENRKQPPAAPPSAPTPPPVDPGSR